MAEPPAPERWVIVLESFGDDERPVGRRVAQLLKHAKRSCGLKCVVVRDAEAAEGQELEKPAERTP